MIAELGSSVIRVTSLASFPTVVVGGASITRNYTALRRLEPRTSAGERKVRDLGLREHRADERIDVLLGQAGDVDVDRRRLRVTW